MESKRKYQLKFYYLDEKHEPVRANISSVGDHPLRSIRYRPMRLPEFNHRPAPSRIQKIDATSEEFNKHSCHSLSAGDWSRDYLRRIANELNINFQDIETFNELCENMKKVLKAREEEKAFEESLYPR